MEIFIVKSSMQFHLSQFFSKKILISQVNRNISIHLWIWAFSGRWQQETWNFIVKTWIMHFHLSSTLYFNRGASSSVAVQPGTTIHSSQQISAESLNLHAGKLTVKAWVGADIATTSTAYVRIDLPCLVLYYGRLPGNLTTCPILCQTSRTTMTSVRFPDKDAYYRVCNLGFFTRSKRNTKIDA